MKPQKLKRSATWWQITSGLILLAGSDRVTKRDCIRDFVDTTFGDSSEEYNVLWQRLKHDGYDCAKVTGFWEVTK